MRDKINEIAAQNGRSANAEIVARLEQSRSSMGWHGILVSHRTRRGEGAQPEAKAMT
ncbi:Arc family DNA-binding protein [Bordetella flabilis]|uniref:Arc family DNA-binding protein n=1 Tax=Bordetella flabilis TaxID=463014 RepID=UPI0009FC32AB